MKALFALLALVAGCALAACASTTRQNTAGRPARLQLVVSIPPSMSFLHEEEISEAFGYRVISALHEQGLRGHIRYVDDSFAAPSPETPTLLLNLLEWRVNRSGFVDCAFTAALEAGGARRELGAFSGTSLMTWSRRDWFARAEGFEDAARDAVTNLAARLQQTGLLDRRPQ
jgi:hypothetical protein